METTPDTTAAITPFTIEIPDEEVADLHRRLDVTRWPVTPTAADTGERGVPTAYLRELADHWRHDFDWRQVEERLNRVPQFVTTIDGQPIHFIHVRSAEPDAVPLILTHGWPSSPFEFLEVIGPLTDPVAHGGDAADAFHVIAPSLPGYGFSTPMRDAGWGNLFRVATAWSELMQRLGYDRYAVQGTDVGSGVAGMLAMVAGERVIGSHLTGTTARMPFGPPVDLDGLSDRDRDRGERFNRFQEEGLGYLHLQATAPQTLAYSLTDSPVGQLAWIVDKFSAWTDTASGRAEEAVGLDPLLTDVTISWFTGAGGSSAHATFEGMQVYRQMAAQAASGGGHGDGPAGPPVGVAVFAADTTIKAVMDPHDEIEHWTEYDRGGHFPAMEVPDLLVDDVRTFFRALR
jgi:epoxide hydrolase